MKIQDVIIPRIRTICPILAWLTDALIHINIAISTFPDVAKQFHMSDVVVQAYPIRESGDTLALIRMERD
jgi:hypothetical protein